MKKAIIFAALITVFTIKPAFNQYAYKVNVKQPSPLIITSPVAINATAGEVIILNNLFDISGSSVYYQTWQFWDGTLLQEIYDTVFTIPGGGKFYLTITNEYGCTALDTIQVNILTGIKEIYHERNGTQKIRIYPNPNAGTFDIIIPDCQPGLSIEIINSLGTLVYLKRLDCNDNEYRATIDLPVVDSGTYLLLVREDEIITFKHKIIIIN